MAEWGDWSTPTISSVAYYKAVVKAMGGISAAQQFTRYYPLPASATAAVGPPTATPVYGT